MFKKAFRRSVFWVAVLGLLVFAIKQFPDQGQEALKAYQNGDYTSAAAFWTKLARKGDIWAQYNLGTLYATGRGVKKDAVAAHNWFLSAAESGLPAAQFEVAKTYETGSGVAPSGPVALLWTRESADQDYPPAQARLGLRYLNGEGVPKDQKKAAFWLARAAGANKSPAIVENGPGGGSALAAPCANKTGG